MSILYVNTTRIMYIPVGKALDRVQEQLLVNAQLGCVKRGMSHFGGHGGTERLWATTLRGGIWCHSRRGALLGHECRKTSSLWERRGITTGLGKTSIHARGGKTTSALDRSAATAGTAPVTTTVTSAAGKSTNSASNVAYVESDRVHSSD